MVKMHFCPFLPFLGPFFDFLSGPERSILGVSRVEKSSFDLSRPLGGRLGHYFQVRAKFGCFWADDMVKMKKTRFL